jgi:hypothetical protein
MSRLNHSQIILILINIEQSIYLFFIERISTASELMRQIKIQCRVILDLLIVHHLSLKLLILHQHIQFFVFIVLYFLLVHFEWFLIEAIIEILIIFVSIVLIPWFFKALLFEIKIINVRHNKVFHFWISLCSLT